MAGFSRVHKHGRGSGRSQCGSDFAAHVAAFAHAHHHHATLDAQHQ